MLVDLEPAAINLLRDIANDEIKAIESGTISYGRAEDNVDTLSLLADAVAVLEDARGY